MVNPQLLDLARLVMTELILKALPDIEAGKPVDMSRVYLYTVRRKMERDIKSDRTFTSLAEKLYFLCELSWEMLSTDQMSLNYRLFPDTHSAVIWFSGTGREGFRPLALRHDGANNAHSQC